MKTRVAFLGLGIMGGPMARNLLRGGCDLRVWNRTSSRMAALVDEGAVRADSPEEAVGEAEFAIAMVADPPALEAIAHGAGGVLAGLPRDAVLINMGTQAIAQMESLAREVHERGGFFLDAPVTGSRAGATEGTLTILAGGENGVLERARPVLGLVGKTILHVGKVGDGTRAKLILNLIQAGMLTVFSESLSLAKRLDLPPATVLQVLEHSAGNAPLFHYKGGFLLRRDFSTNFSLRLMNKDLKLVLGEADRLGARLDASRTVSDVFSAAVAAGYSEEDFLAIAKVIEKLAGTILGP